jgi:hypothetical protein
MEVKAEKDPAGDGGLIPIPSNDLKRKIKLGSEGNFVIKWPHEVSCREKSWNN